LGDSENRAWGAFPRCDCRTSTMRISECGKTRNESGRLYTWWQCGNGSYSCNLSSVIHMAKSFFKNPQRFAARK
jgi:hypothetical protein